MKLSSCGLVYKHHGKEALANILSEEWQIKDPACLEYTYAKLYDEFVMTIDAWDNGVNQYPPDLKPKYHVNSHLATRVSRLNPSWNVETGSPDEGFMAAMNIAEEELLWQIYSQACVIYPAFELVEKAYKEREKFHASGQLVYFDQGCPWKEHLTALEEADAKKGAIKPILFVICKEKDKSEFRVQGIPDKPGSFKCRVFLMEKWRGLRGEELQKVSGLTDAVFVHSSGFLGIAKSLDSVLKMAEGSMKATPPATTTVTAPEANGKPATAAKKQ